MPSRAASPTRSPPSPADVRLLFAALLVLQSPRRVERPELRAGLDTLYGGGFPAAAGYFADLARQDSADPAPVIFEASAYIWWAAALENDAYARVLAADSSCADCYLGLGVYQYGLARAGALARLVAKLVGLGSGNAEQGIRYMRRAAVDGDLARVEAGWVLAAALVREAARAAPARAALQRAARDAVTQLAERYPGNPVFQRFLREIPAAAP